MSEISIDYEPREQFIPFHQRHTRWSCIVAHRRAGKTVACVAELVTRSVYTSKKNPRYGYIAPFYRQAKEIAWRYLKDMTKGMANKVMESTLTIELFNGALIQLFGADNPDALRGLYFDGVVLDEFGDMKPSLWAEVVLPALADRKGWAVFIGTPKGKNQFYEIYERSKKETKTWFSLTLRASETGLLPSEELSELRAQMDEEEYDREMECSFEAAVSGTYYAKILNELVAKKQVLVEQAKWTPALTVSVATDLGRTDSSAYWFWQERPGGLAIVDYHEADGQNLDYYFDMLEAKPYDYETIWLPHDARAKHLSSKRSTVEQFVDHFRNRDKPVSIHIVERLAVQHGIDAVRAVLPMCYFAPETADGVECLREYRREYDEGKKVFKDNPLHNWASHGADGFRYLSLVAKRRIMAAKEKKEKPQYQIGRYAFTLDELFEDHEKQLSRDRRYV